MGRYTTIQAYADNNPCMRSVKYEAAAGEQSQTKHVKPEKVDNPYGSTAGAGSGEFHVYRHARSREMERMKNIDKEQKENVLELEFRSIVEKNKVIQEGRTEKRRNKRKRQMEAKKRKKNIKKMGIDINEKREEAVDEDEFSYEPAKNKDIAEVINIQKDWNFLKMKKKLDKSG